MEYKDELDRMRDRQRNPERYKKKAVKKQVTEDLDESDYYNPPRRENSRSRKDDLHRDIRAARKKRRRKKRMILAVELVVLAVLLVSVYRFFKKDTGYWNIAVFGVDSRDGNLGKGALADVDLICSINKETGEIKLVSVFRDTYLKIDDNDTYFKMNEAYFKGGPKQALSTLNTNLDLDIDDYVTFNWKAVADTINILGGIDLEISDSEFKYINSFITETVESTGVASVHLASAGMNHLDGVQAVAYARLRLMDTDFNRTARQRKVITLAMEKARNADFAVLNNILVTVFPQVSTNLGIDDMIPLAKNVKKYHIGETSGFPFAHAETKINKRDSVIPLTLESNVIQLHEFLFGVTDFKPSSTVKTISARIAKDSGMGEVGKDTETGRKDPSSGGGSKKESSAQPAPQETAPPETEPVIEESTTEEETSTETEETSEEVETKETESETEIGPGVNLDEEDSKPEESKKETKPEKPEETQKQEDKKPGTDKTTEAPENQGPGSDSIKDPTSGTNGPKDPAGNGPGGNPGASEETKTMGPGI